MNNEHFLDLEPEIGEVIGVTEELTTVTNVLFNEYFKNQDTPLFYSYETASQLMNVVLRLTTELNKKTQDLDKLFYQLWNEKENKEHIKEV